MLSSISTDGIDDQKDWAGGERERESERARERRESEVCERQQVPRPVGPAGWRSAFLFAVVQSTLLLASGDQFENNYLTEVCSGSEAGSYLRLIDFVYHSTLGLRVIKKKKKRKALGREVARRKEKRGKITDVVQK